VLYWHQVRISNRRQGNGPQIYWGRDLDLSGSRDVISYWWSIGPKSLSPSVFGIFGLSILRHDRDLSGSGDVIGHATI